MKKKEARLSVVERVWRYLRRHGSGCREIKQNGNFSKCIVIKIFKKENWNNLAKHIRQVHKLKIKSMMDNNIFSVTIINNFIQIKFWNDLSFIWKLLKIKSLNTFKITTSTNYFGLHLFSHEREIILDFCIFVSSFI